MEKSRKTRHLAKNAESDSQFESSLAFWTSSVTVGFSLSNISSKSDFLVVSGASFDALTHHRAPLIGSFFPTGVRKGKIFCERKNG